VALVFAGIALRTLYAQLLIASNAHYIKTNLLPRVGRFYNVEPTELYGWEEAFSSTYDLKGGQYTSVGELLLYGIPVFVLLGYGTAESVRSSFGKTLTCAISGVLLLASVAVVIYAIAGIVSAFNFANAKNRATSARGAPERRR
jgi:hypothetical protein